MYTIYIVEDDAKIAAILRSAIAKYDYEVKVAEDFGRVLEEFKQAEADLVLLDVNLPKYDGYYWCRQIRAQSLCPILFISARDSQMDQVMALENGADDYITKPFDSEIVLAKIRSHLRRAYGSYAKTQAEEHKVGLGGLTLFPERFIVQYHDQSTELTPKESALLAELMQREGRVVSRDRLLDIMWEDQHFIDDNTLNVYITRVRRKLKELGIGDCIETVRGAGYRIKTEEIFT